LGGCIDSLVLSYETTAHEHGRVLLKFHSDDSGDWRSSKWQFQSCGQDRGPMDGGMQ